MIKDINMYRSILGIKFFVGPPEDAITIGMSGGLVLVPAAPALVDIQKDKWYREALLAGDLVITDSGLLVLLWFLRYREKIVRLSGLEYLRLLLEKQEIRDSRNVAWIMPSNRSISLNLSWLASQGILHGSENCYLAPVYPNGEINDFELLKWLNEKKPKHIIIAIGGGTQERLGLSLKRTLPRQTSIHCIGAAIGFLSGDQIRIPAWADYLYIGWLFRCLSDPKKFVPRYMKALNLIPIFLKNKTELPIFVGENKN